MAKTKLGRASIFRGKDGGHRVQAIITKHGGKKFEEARTRLALLYERVVGKAPKMVSDADVVEAMARGDADTTRYLAENK